MSTQRDRHGSLSRVLARGRFAATAAAASVVWLTLQAGVAQAVDGSWNLATGNGYWSTSASWFGSPNPVPGGAGSTVWFTNNITAARAVTIDTTSRTVGVLNIGSGNGLYAFTLGASGGATLTFDNGGSNARLNQISTSTNSTISAPILLNSPMDIANASGNTLTLSGTITNTSASAVTISNQGSGSGGVIISGVIQNSAYPISVTQNSATSKLTLTPVNTYTGTTTINAGTLALTGATAVGGSANIVIMAGATFDVSGATVSIKGSAPVQTLGCGSTSGTAIVNATGRTLTLASGALLAFQADGTSGTVGKMVVTNNLALNNNGVTVNVNGSTLAQGTYRLIECTGTLTGAAGGEAAMTGTPLSNGCFGFIQTTAGAAGYVDLVVRKAPDFTGGSYDGFDSRSILNSGIPKKTGTLIRFF